PEISIQTSYHFTILPASHTHAHTHSHTHTQRERERERESERERCNWPLSADTVTQAKTGRENEREWRPFDSILAEQSMWGTDTHTHTHTHTHIHTHTHTHTHTQE